MDNINLSQIRQDYTLKRFDEKDALENPILQFGKWFEEALKAEVNEVNAMALSTISEKEFPSSRIVLLKGIEDDKFVFFTNYNSQKGRDISINNKASLLFFWPELQRQVRIEGYLSKITENKSDAYFKTRPRASQIGAHVSNQSSKIESRAVLEDKMIALTQAFENAEIPRPNYWGGYALEALSYEFWQGRASRLHDRIFYEKKESKWVFSRLSP